MIENNPSLVATIGDFNARSSSWSINGKSNYEGAKINCLTTEYDLKLKNSLFALRILLSGIVVIFTFQPNLVIDASFHPFLHENCHHQIVYAKLNLKIQHPPPYEGEIWHFRKSY